MQPQAWASTLGKLSPDGYVFHVCIFLLWKNMLFSIIFPAQKLPVVRFKLGSLGLCSPYLPKASLRNGGVLAHAAAAAQHHAGDH